MSTTLLALQVADKYHKEREEKLVIKRQYDAMRRDYARQRKSSSKTKEELEGTIRKLASTIEVCTACSAVWNGFVRQESVQGEVSFLIVRTKHYFHFLRIITSSVFWHV